MTSTINHQLSTSTFFQGKKVLVTGHTGFKGSWLTLWLQRQGAHVTGISLPTATEPNLFTLLDFPHQSSTISHQPSTINHQPSTIGHHPFSSHFCDIRDAASLKTIVQAARPEIVFHLAAQPLVRASYRDPLETFSSNVMGTAHLLDALRGLDSARVAVMVTTDKVFRNQEWPYPYREDDALGGHDPYSASKAASEIVIASYRDAFLSGQGVAVASARAGNVIGGGDWSEDRLIPDAVRAWQAGRTLEIRRPQAIRPWQHVLEPLSGYLTLAQKLWAQPELAGAYNFGPQTHEAASVRDVVELARAAYGSGDVRYGDGTAGPHEAGWLALETAKSRELLGVIPKWALAESVNRTMAWYRAQHEGADARSLCEAEIAAYEALP